MGNQLIEQCTSDQHKIEGFDGDMSLVIHPSPSKPDPQTGAIPSRNQTVEQTYRSLLSQRAIAYTLEEQKATLQPIRLSIFGEEGVFIGWTKGDKPHGPGQLYFDSFKYLQAIFKEGEVDCEDGLFIEPTGNYYRGGFKKSRQSGGGTLRRGADTIIATFEKGAAEGKGEKMFGDGRVYKGSFKNGKMEGKGVVTYPNGHEYSGYFRENRREGIGKMKTQQYEYFGPFKADKKEGKGTVIFNDGSKFQGWFQDDRIQGYGEWHRPDGKIEKGSYSLNLTS